MPITVRKDIKVAELRKGDRLDEMPPAIVESLTRKATWGAVQVEGEARPRRLRLDAGITVLREEPTEQEQECSRRTFIVAMLTDELIGWLKRDPARMLREIVDNDRGYGEVVTWSNLSDVLKAQAMFKQARILWHHLGEPADLAAVEEDALLEAFASWWHSNVHRLADQGPRHDPISRSTSIISNIIDDCDDWAIQQIRWRIRSLGAGEEIQRRVMQLVAARP